jgi:hypothetical protein
MVLQDGGLAWGCNLILENLLLRNFHCLWRTMEVAKIHNSAAAVVKKKKNQCIYLKKLKK